MWRGRPRLTCILPSLVVNHAYRLEAFRVLYDQRTKNFQRHKRAKLLGSLPNVNKMRHTFLRFLPDDN